MTDLQRRIAAVIASGDPEAHALAYHTEALRRRDWRAVDHWQSVLDDIHANSLTGAEGVASVGAEQPLNGEME